MDRPRVDVVNLANLLTAFRIASVPVILYLMQSDWGSPGMVGDWGKVAAVFLALAAGITDYIDGLVARTQQVETKLGKFLDPVADKLLVCSLFVVFVAQGVVEWWVLVVMLWREFLVLGLRMHLASDGHVLGASHWAKFKTIFQVSAVVAILLVQALQVLAISHALTVRWATMIYFARICDSVVQISVLFAVVSGLEYFWVHRYVLKRG